MSKTKVSVIPNAVDPEVFRPDPDRVPPGLRSPRVLRVAIGSRLVYRKGVDLVVAVIPRYGQKLDILTN